MMADDRTGLTLWSERTVECVIVPGSGGPAVELRNEQGVRSNPARASIAILVVTASPQDAAGEDCSDAVLTKPCLLPTLLAASRLLLQRVMPAPQRRQAAS